MKRKPKKTKEDTEVLSATKRGPMSSVPCFEMQPFARASRSFAISEDRTENDDTKSGTLVCVGTFK